MIIWRWFTRLLHRTKVFFLGDAASARIDDGYTDRTIGEAQAAVDIEMARFGPNQPPANRR